MSLLKARRIVEKNIKTQEDMFQEFQNNLDVYIDNSSVVNALHIIDAYCKFSYGYLLITSQTLEALKRDKDRMVYMNSIIAEVCHETTVPYFHPTNTYSIIDKGVKHLIDEGIQDNIKYLEDIVADMEEAKRLVNDEIVEEA